MTKKRWVWVLLFIIVVVLLAVLATSWNLVLVRDYQKTAGLPTASLVLGTLGFIGTMALIVVFFIKLLREMKLNQTQAEFLAAVSHELKTPISTMELSTSLLRDPTTSSEEAERLWISHDEELKRLKSEVETLLEAAQWESKSIRLKKSPVTLENWLDESFGRWKKILGHQAELKREGAKLNCVAHVDLKLLNLVIDNLIDNARKFSKDIPLVTIRSSLLHPKRPWQSHHWKIEIIDQGWGFDPADSKKIFRRFYRAKSQAPYSVAGTGLGLYLAASASRSMGIALSAESQGRGHGAIFTLEGPLKFL